MAHGIQFGHGKHTSERIVVCVNCKLISIQIVMKLVCNSPFQCQQLKFMDTIVPLRWCKIPAGISDHPLCALLFLGKDGPETIKTCSSMHQERFGIIGISQFSAANLALAGIPLTNTLGENLPSRH